MAEEDLPQSEEFLSALEAGLAADADPDSARSTDTDSDTARQAQKGPLQADLSLAELLARQGTVGSAPQEQLFCLFYRELHRLARRQLSTQRQNAATLGVTTLLHEAYLKVAAQPDLSFASPGHFIAYAARAMRGLIVDHARRCASQKRGGEFDLVRLDTQTAETLAAPHDVIRIDEHLNELQAIAPDLAHLVDLKFFCGLSFREIAETRGCSERTVHRDWDKARALLGAMLRGDVGAAST